MWYLCCYLGISQIKTGPHYVTHNLPSAMITDMCCQAQPKPGILFEVKPRMACLKSH